MRTFLLALAFVLASCLPAHAAVTFDANATASCTSNAVTAINCSTLTVGSGANRALVCQIVWSGSVTNAALKWDNAGTPQSLTAITGAIATETIRSQLWGLIAPTSGALQLRATWTTSRDVVVNCVSWTGVDQTGGDTSFPNGAGNIGLSGTTASVSVTSAVGDAVIAAHAINANGTAVNNTQTFINNTPTNVSGCGNRASGAASVSMTCTLNASSFWASSGASIKAFPCTPSLTLLGVGRCN